MSLTAVIWEFDGVSLWKAPVPLDPSFSIELNRDHSELLYFVLKRGGSGGMFGQCEGGRMALCGRCPSHKPGDGSPPLWQQLRLFGYP